MRFNARRTFLFLVSALTLWLGAPYSVAREGRAELDRRRNWLMEHTMIQRNDVAHCNVLRQQGVAFGRHEFQKVAPGCPELYVYGSYMARALEEVRVFLPLPAQGFEQACYQSGWLQGYLLAHGELFPVCEAQLETVVRERLLARVAACEALGEKIREDSISLGTFIEEQAAEDARSDASLLLGRMLALVKIGRSGEAWEQMIESQQHEIFGSLPCTAAIGSKLLQ